MTAKIAYIMSRFPHLSETFILREMNELERHGWDIALYPLILQEQEIVHPEAESWLSRVRHVPYLSGQVLKANAKAWAQHPFRSLSLWGRTLGENVRSPNFLMRATALLPKAFEMARLMQEEGITHIHAHYATHPALVAWLIHRLTGISYSITVHAHDIFVEQAMLATKLRDATFIAAISEYNREYLAKVVGPWVRKKTHIVHCGVVLEHYQARSTEAMPQDGERFELISTGSLQPYKGHAYLIGACALLRERGIALRCRIIGEGKERPALEQMISQTGLEDVVELLGAQPQQEVARLLSTAHCYVQPSVITPSGKMEGIPVSLMEALACGLPVVATKLSGIPELVQHNKTGYLVKPADATALANALTKLYNNPTSATQLAQEGRALVAREFELSRNVQQLAELFRNGH
jgi:glycosyltransferase involved in cell wall biosynthesis